MENQATRRHKRKKSA